MSYIQEQILAIRADQINAKKDERYQRNYTKQLILTFVAVVMVVAHCYGDEITCPHCSGSIDVGVEARGIFGETWKCPKCGYENYVGVKTCPQCGYCKKN